MLPDHSQSDLFEQIGRKLQGMRQARREKLATVAKVIGVNHSVVSQIENGRYGGLSIKMLHSLADYYNIPVDELIAP